VYDRLIELGILHEDEAIELLAGRLVVREPQRTPHATATQLAADALRAAFGVGWSVRVQLPIALDDESEPEPDAAVVPGAPRDCLREHPSAPVLVVEVAHEAPALRISVADLLP
jgi:Uma2 family endonuclease